MKNTITIEIVEVPTNEMHLKLHYGDGSLGETKFHADFMLPTYSLLVEVEGKKYKVSQQALIEAVVDFHCQQR